MRWIPSKCDPQQLIYPTRPAQRSTTAGDLPVRPVDRASDGSMPFFCVQLIDFGGIVLDFEGCAVVVGAARHFLELRHFAAATVVLMAEGDPVSLHELASICEIKSPKYSRDSVNRIVRRLNEIVSVTNAFMYLPSVLAGRSRVTWAYMSG